MFFREKAIVFEEWRWPNARSWIKFCQRESRLVLLKRSSVNSGLCAFCAVKNEADILPAFLEHYRRLGVDQFVFVDNASDDGTVEFLSGQHDVHLFSTQQPFSESFCGRLWTDYLAFKMQLGQWVLTLDADELLVYEAFEKVRLPDLIGLLQRSGRKRLFAPMIDLYDLEDGVYFDAAPERTDQRANGPWVNGGPRMRMELSRGAIPPLLSKYPLTVFDRRTSYASTHLPFPVNRNDAGCFARLLHHKIKPRLRAKIDEALQGNQHWNDSADYKVYDEWFGTDLRETFSQRYEGPHSLIEASLMDPVPRGRAKLSPYKWDDTRRI